MSVLVVTSLGDIVVDLFTDRCPLTCKNFLKLCKIKYYNGCLFHSVQKDFTAQTGDPTGTGSGGDSIYKFLYGDQARFFTDEIHHDLKHSKMGTLAMASAGENLNASQFYLTLRDDLDYIDEKHTVFGEIAEGLETLTRINEAFVDEKNRPYKNIRIKHTYILDDPFDDPPGIAELIPEASPEGKPKDEVETDVRLEDDWVPMDEQLGPAELEEVIRAKDAHTRAVVLESIGDIPDAEIRPPDNVLFVCKLNPVTEDEDLHTIFSRFGTVVSADIIRDWKTGDSLCYAFIEFESRESCEQAYFKMDNALIDDRRIHVDFSQSVAKLWSQFRRKDHHNGKGGGCFKCGSIDHVAKDCTGGPAANLQPSKYVLKNDNMQRGGDDNSRYEMVFDEDTPEIPRRVKQHEAHDEHKMSRHRSSGQSHRNNEKRDAANRPSEKNETGDRRENRRRSDGRDLHDREAVFKRPRDKYEQSNGKTRAGNDDHERRHNYRDHRKRSAENYDGERKEIDDQRRRSADVDERETRGHADRKNRSADDGEKQSSDYRDHRKRSAEDDGERKEIEDQRQRSADVDEREMRGHADRKNRSADDGEKQSRDHRDHRKRSAENDGGRKEIEDQRRSHGNRRNRNADDGENQSRVYKDERKRSAHIDDDIYRERRGEEKISTSPT